VRKNRTAMKIAVLALCVSVMGWSAQDKLPEGAGKAALEKVCTDCHGTDVVVGMGNSREDWQDLVNEMVTKGATATKDQIKEIVDYLAKNFPQKK